MNKSLVVRLERKTVETLDICGFEFVDVNGENLPCFSAGAHIDVHLPNGLVRQYSLCNDPVETHRYLIAVLRNPSSRGGSVAMHALAQGQTLAISAPKNHFALAPQAPHSLLLAGGIGITPILCMAEHLSNIGAPFTLHYCSRSPEHTAFASRIEASAFARRVFFHHDSGEAQQKLDMDALLAEQPTGTHLYVCGPTGFMDAVLHAARQSAWSEERLHREYFAGAAPALEATDGSFEVQIASSGRVIFVTAERSVVAALAEAGINVPVSCEQGVCGTCLTRVMEGTPDHRDMFLTPEEQALCDQFTPCCSRSKSVRLVLDL